MCFLNHTCSFVYVKNLSSNRNSTRSNRADDLEDKHSNLNSRSTIEMYLSFSSFNHLNSLGQESIMNFEHRMNSNDFFLLLVNLALNVYTTLYWSENLVVSLLLKQLEDSLSTQRQFKSASCVDRVIAHLRNRRAHITPIQTSSCNFEQLFIIVKYFLRYKSFIIQIKNTFICF